MNQVLPTLSLKKSKEIVLLNVSNFSAEFSATMTQYNIKPVSGSMATQQLNKLIGISKPEDAPYAIIADYSMLAKDGFSFVKALKNNLLTANIPLIAIAEQTDALDPRSLKIGIDDCYVQPVDYRDICERIEFLRRFKSQMSSVKAEEMDELEVSISPFKRALDIVISSICIVFLSPILVMTAILIRLESRGPIVYRSKRSGTGYDIFDFFKFRSMYPDADQRLEEMQHLNQYAGENSAFVKFKNDPRITKVGKIIRKTSIDELPQLFNVLRGDMSIVGNRPLPLYEAEQLTKEDMAYRFIAPAGITGLWQVTKRGGNDMSAEERIGLDVTYAHNNSFWYDLKILLRTPFAIIQKENV